MSNSKICRVNLIQGGVTFIAYVSDDLVRSCLFALTLFKDFTESCSIVVEQTISDGVVKDVLVLER